MNNTLHTPGHWNLTFGEYDAAIHSDVTIASINDDALAWKENARLISAAPDLLSALESLLKSSEVFGRFDAQLDAREAIRKAKGEA
jgi:hypothetical protein